MLYKTTKRLFQGKYQYKIVLVCSGAHYFRNGDMDAALMALKEIDITKASSNIHPHYGAFRAGPKTKEDLDYCFRLQKQLKKLTDIDIRVESPWITIYANSRSIVDNLAKIDSSKVKYISIPPENTALTKNTVIMPKMPFEYRVTMGKTTQPYDAFVQWATGNAKLKLTKSCRQDLEKSRSWGGTHFYISGDNNILMAKMHLGSSINKIERIIKA